MKLMMRALAVTSLALSQMGGCVNPNLNNDEPVVPVTMRVSVASDGTEANAGSFLPSISANGRYVAFASFATNLSRVPWSGGKAMHVYRKDMWTGAVELVDVTADGTRPPAPSADPAISGDGRFVCFTSTTHPAAPSLSSGPFPLVYRRDMNDPDPYTRIQCVSLTVSDTVPNGPCYSPSVSGDARFVAFVSSATNLLDTPTGSGIHVYRRDMSSSLNHTVMVSVTKDGGIPPTKDNITVNSTAPSISGDGRFVAFTSNAVDIAESPITFQDRYQIYRRDLEQGVSLMVTVDTAGRASAMIWEKYTEAAPVISADGEVIAFSWGNGGLVSDDDNWKTDVFVRNIPAKTTTRVSVSNGEAEGNGDSGGISQTAEDKPGSLFRPDLSADGRFVVFLSDASNLVANDRNDARDIFMRDIVAGTTLRISVATGGGESHPGSGPFVSSFAVSADGSFVAFASTAADLTAVDLNGSADIFRRGPLR